MKLVANLLRKHLSSCVHRRWMTTKPNDESIKTESIIQSISSSLAIVERKFAELGLFQQLARITETIQASNIWENEAENASELLKKQASLQDRIGRLQKMKEECEFQSQMLQIAREEGDAAMQRDMSSALSLLASNASEFEIETLMDDPADAGSALLEIHAGAGGTESCDWVTMLLRMYSRFSFKRGYTTEIVDEVRDEVGGYRTVVIRISGSFAFGWLKTEAGVHRLVRISPFDASGRRHTSFASVQVFPLLDEVTAASIDINMKDLKFDTFRASGAGGQHVNKTESGVRITHIPTGIVVHSQSDRSQHRNRAVAMDNLRGRLYDRERRLRSDSKAAAAASLGENGFGSQIRNYVLYPYKLVKDVRTGIESSEPDSVLDGDLDVFVKAALSQSVNVS